MREKRGIRHFWRFSSTRHQPWLKPNPNQPTLSTKPPKPIPTTTLQIPQPRLQRRHSGQAGRFRAQDAWAQLQALEARLGQLLAITR
ncbi:hypothetical protein D3C71_715440 [compost metagenome]